MKSEVEILEDGVRVQRTFSASIDRVFAAWTEPERVQAWWGCAKTESVRSFIDLRVGGEYRHVMQTKEGGEFDAKGVITELDAPNCFAYEVTFPPMEGMPPMKEQSIRVVFEEVDGGTRLTLTHLGIDIEQIRGEVKKGWSAAFEKLDGQLHPAHS